MTPVQMPLSECASAAPGHSTSRSPAGDYPLTHLGLFCLLTRGGEAPPPAVRWRWGEPCPYVPHGALLSRASSAPPLAGQLLGWSVSRAI